MGNPGELIRSFFVGEFIVTSITREVFPVVEKICTSLPSVLKDLHLTNSDLSTLSNVSKSCVGM